MQLRSKLHDACLEEHQAHTAVRRRVAGWLPTSVSSYPQPVLEHADEPAEAVAATLQARPIAIGCESSHDVDDSGPPNIRLLCRSVELRCKHNGKVNAARTDANLQRLPSAVHGVLQPCRHLRAVQHGRYKLSGVPKRGNRRRAGRVRPIHHQLVGAVASQHRKQLAEHSDGQVQGAVRHDRRKYPQQLHQQWLQRCCSAAVQHILHAVAPT